MKSRSRIILIYDFYNLTIIASYHPSLSGFNIKQMVKLCNRIRIFQLTTSSALQTAPPPMSPLLATSSTAAQPRSTCPSAMTSSTSTPCLQGCNAPI